MLDDVTKAVKHVAQAVRFTLVVQHFVQEDAQRGVAKEVRVEGCDLARL